MRDGRGQGGGGAVPWPWPCVAILADFSPAKHSQGPFGPSASGETETDNFLLLNCRLNRQSPARAWARTKAVPTAPCCQPSPWASISPHSTNSWRTRPTSSGAHIFAALHAGWVWKVAVAGGGVGPLHRFIHLNAMMVCVAGMHRPRLTSRPTTRSAFPLMDSPTWPASIS